MNYVYRPKRLSLHDATEQRASGLSEKRVVRIVCYSMSRTLMGMASHRFASRQMLTLGQRESTRSFSVAIATRPRIPRSSLACVPIACQQHISMRNASWFSRSQPEPQPQTASPTAFVPDDAPASASPSATLHPPPEPPLAGTSDAASSLPEQPAYTNDFIGFLEKDYGIDFGWGTSSLVKYLFEHIHVYSGLPFAASIVLTGAVIRFAMIFAQRESVETSTRMSAMMPITKPLMARSTAAKLAGDSQESQKIRVELGRIYNESGIKIWKLGLGLLHIPLGFGCWRTFRNMADIPVAGLTTGGLGWFKDLTVADPFMVLPISTAAVQYFSTKVFMTRLDCIRYLIRLTVFILVGRSECHSNERTAAAIPKNRDQRSPLPYCYLHQLRACCCSATLLYDKRIRALD